MVNKDIAIKIQWTKAYFIDHEIAVLADKLIENKLSNDDDDVVQSVQFFRIEIGCQLPLSRDRSECF